MASFTSSRSVIRLAEPSTHSKALDRGPPFQPSFSFPLRSAPIHPSGRRFSGMADCMNWRTCRPPGSRSEGNDSLKKTTLFTGNHRPLAVRMQGRTTRRHGPSEVSSATAAHSTKSKVRRCSCSSGRAVHHLSIPSSHARSSTCGGTSARRPVFRSRSRALGPRTSSMSTGPFRRRAGCRAGSSRNAFAKGGGGRMTSPGFAKAKVSVSSVHTGNTAASSSRVRNLDSQRPSASSASRPTSSGDGGARALKAALAVAGSENVRAIQQRKTCNKSAKQSTMPRCQWLSSISQSPLREMFNSQSALMCRPKGKVTSVGKVA